MSKKIAKSLLPGLGKELKKEGVTIKACKNTKKILTNSQVVKEEDFYEEYLDLILNIKIVENIE